MSKDRVNPEDCEAVSDALMREAGIEFGTGSAIYTEKQMERLRRRRGEVSLDALNADVSVRSSQEILDIARDELRAGRVAGIDDDQRSILLFLLNGSTQREIADHFEMSVGWVNEEIQAIRRRIDNNSSIWVWIVLAEVFEMAIASVRDELGRKKN